MAPFVKLLDILNTPESPFIFHGTGGERETEKVVCIQSTQNALKQQYWEKEEDKVGEF